MKKILVINGPNLNMLGRREKEHYGSFTLEELEERIRKYAEEKKAKVDFFQSNSEGDIVSKIQSACGEYDGIIINPGAYTHTSIAIRDAFLATGIPFIEVHISNIFAREEFRRRSYLSDIAKGVITGLGMEGYILALQYFLG
jgi:3-dehydroquinate dehydratase-2